MPNQLSNLRRKLTNTDKQRRYAWAKYYDECANEVERLLLFIQPMRRAINEERTPTFLINEFEELMEKCKHKYQCSICLEDLKKENLRVVKCGHFILYQSMAK